MQKKGHIHKTILIGSLYTFVTLCGGKGALMYAQDLSDMVRAGANCSSSDASYACFNFQNATFSNNGTFTLSGTMPTASSSWTSFDRSGGDFTSTLIHKDKQQIVAIMF